MRDTSVPAEYTCRKCIQFQLLEERVGDLELELDELGIIREAAIDRSCRELATPRNDMWVTARRGKKQSEQRSLVPLYNKCSILDTVGGGGGGGGNLMRDVMPHKFV